MDGWCHGLLVGLKVSWRVGWLVGVTVGVAVSRCLGVAVSWRRDTIQVNKITQFQLSNYIKHSLKPGKKKSED